jgi:hypothetical protein
MGNSTYNIQVTDVNGTITVTPDPLTMNIDESVSWTLTPGSDPDAALKIDFTDGSGFKHKKYDLNASGGFGLVATEKGSYSYTVSTADGTRSIDPIIIVGPINLPPPAKN